jgi:hypothetical protein
MNIILSQHGFSPIDVRVIKKMHEAGGSRSFGFIDFRTLEEAKRYMHYTKVDTLSKFQIMTLGSFAI